ncbi:MAG: PAC2 family protein, partial [Dehalococcoidia bacterium]
MGVRLYHEPPLEAPVLVTSWPGIGNIVVIAADSLKDILGAEEFGELEPQDFFYPRRALIRKGVLEYLEFDGSKLHSRSGKASDR